MIATSAIKLWRTIKDREWVVDATTMRRLREFITDGLAEHHRIADGITDQTARDEFNDYFAVALDNARAARDEITNALSILPIVALNTKEPVT